MLPRLGCRAALVLGTRHVGTCRKGRADPLFRSYVLCVPVPRCSRRLGRCLPADAVPAAPVAGAGWLCYLNGAAWNLSLMLCPPPVLAAASSAGVGCALPWTDADLGRSAPLPRPHSQDFYVEMKWNFTGAFLMGPLMQAVAPSDTYK